MENTNKYKAGDIVAYDDNFVSGPYKITSVKNDIYQLTDLTETRKYFSESFLLDKYFRKLSKLEIALLKLAGKLHV